MSKPWHTLFLRDHARQLDDASLEWLIADFRDMRADQLERKRQSCNELIDRLNCRKIAIWRAELYKREHGRILT